MKSLRLIFGLSALLLVVACDLSAQSSNSAKQTVTFGVQRIAPIILASKQASTPVLVGTVGGTLTPLKVSVGTSLRSETSVDLSIADNNNVSLASSISRNSNLPAKKFSTSTSATIDRSVVTLTE